MRKPIFILLIVLTASAYAQDRSKFLYADFSDKSVTLYPFYKPFGNNFDPAVTLGGGLNYRQKGNVTLFQTVQVSAYSTTMVGNGLTLTSSFGYRYSHSSGFFGEAMAGLGPTLFFFSRQIYTMDEEREYVPSNPLHINAVLPLDFLIGYGSGKLSLYIKYRYMVTGPFTSAMPVLPNSLLGMGIRYNINKS